MQAGCSSVRMISLVAHDKLYGYLVVWERCLDREDPEWEFLGFAVSFHYAALMADDWGRGQDPNHCPACRIQSIARIFEVPMDEYYSKENPGPAWRKRLG
jgi:hypothetical protein